MISRYGRRSCIGLEELLLIRHGGEHAGTTSLLPPVVTAAGQSISEAEVCFRRAIDIARGQQARSLELRAATSLARLWINEGKGTEARDLLCPSTAGSQKDLTHGTCERRGRSSTRSIE